MTEFTLTIKNYRCFPDEEPLRLRLSRGFTSFIGPNNSGKSALLRLFYDLRRFFGVLGRPQSRDLGTAFQADTYMDELVTALPGERVFSNLNQRDLQVEFSWTAPSLLDGEVVRHVLAATIRRKPSSNLRLSLRIGSSVFEGAGFAWDAESFITRSNARLAEASDLRDLCASLSNSMYIGPFRNTINIGGVDNYFDIAVGNKFIQQFQEMKAGYQPDSNEAVFQLQRDIQRIFEFDSFDINATPDGQNLQITVDGRSFRPTELGGGIAHFIIVLANVLQKNPDWIFLDEPELNLHSTLQLDFLMTVGAYASQGLMFATHSLGLARAASDITYSVVRKEQGRSQLRVLEDTPRLAEFVGELGFGGYREIGFKKLLLVEGATEIKTLQQFLRLYGREHEIAMVHLGGGAMINSRSEAELLELTRISDDVYALIDSERSVAEEGLSSERQAFVATCDAVGIPVHVLERRALENYFTDRAVKHAFGQPYVALQPYESLQEVSLSWSKRDNWRAAQSMSKSELATTDLGHFLASL